jgi:hypothetical protein
MLTHQPLPNFAQHYTFVSLSLPPLELSDLIHKKIAIGSDQEKTMDELGLSGDIGPPQILVSYDNNVALYVQDLIIIGVNSHDRPGLLNEISKCLTGLKLQCHRAEAAVIGLRSLSVWRCERLDTPNIIDVEGSSDTNILNEIWESLKVQKRTDKNAHNSDYVIAFVCFIFLFIF